MKYLSENMAFPFEAIVNEMSDSYPLIDLDSTEENSRNAILFSV